MSKLEAPREAGGRVLRAAQRLVPVGADELRAALWSAGLMFAVLCSFYILRPVRDAMGVAGKDRMQWLFTATFFVMLAVVPLYSALVARLPPRRFIPLMYRLFAAILLAFFAALHLATGAARAFAADAYFVWVSVYNLFVLSIAWALMADVWRREQGERLFGFIAAGGSVGALVGPVVTMALVPELGVAPLLLVSALCLELAVLCQRRLVRALPESAEGHVPKDRPERALGGGALAAFALVLRSPRLLGIAAYMLGLTLTGTFAYFEQTQIVGASVADEVARTQLFARVDLAVNAIALTLQALVVGRLMPAVGVGWTLALLPLISLVGFGALWSAPVLATLVAFQIARRAADFSLSKPAREVLFTLVDREAKYKAKHFIDTAVYRGGDLVGAWLFRGAEAAGLGLSGLAAVAAGMCVPWAALSFGLGRAARERQVREDMSPGTAQPPANT